LIAELTLVDEVDEVDEYWRPHDLLAGRNVAG